MNNRQENKNSFLYPIKSYHGKFTPNNLAFSANLQEFTQKVGYICSLETNGKISTKNAYRQINFFWNKLEESKKNLLDNTDFSNHKS